MCAIFLGLATNDRDFPECTLGRAGQAYRGHEFHYTGVIEEGTSNAPGDALFAAADAEENDLGPTGLMDGRIAGSFIHLIDGE